MSWRSYTVRKCTKSQEEAAIIEFCASIGSAITQINNLPEISGYEALLRRRGLNHLPARGLAYLIMRHAHRVTKERAAEPTFTRAVRELAQRGTGPLSRRRRAQELLDLWDSNTLITTVCELTEVDDFKFVDLLRKLVAGDASVEGQLHSMAKAILTKWNPHIGPRPSIQSAAHEYLQRALGTELDLARYTYSEEHRGCIDEASIATAKAFGLDRFDPRPADRRRFSL